MSEKRYLVKGYGVAPNGENIFGIFDSRTKSPYHLYAFNDDGLNKIARILNEQQATIRKLQDLCGESDGENAKLRMENKKLKAKLKEKEEDERLYANEIVKLNKEAKEVLDFKSLGGDY